MLLLQLNKQADGQLNEWVRAAAALCLSRYARDEEIHLGIGEGQTLVVDSSDNQPFITWVSMQAKAPVLAVPALLKFEVGYQDTHFSDTHLQLCFIDAGQLLWRFDANLFNRRHIERMADSLAILLSAVADNPQQTIYQLPLLNTQDTHILREQGRGRSVPDVPSVGEMLHKVFENGNGSTVVETPMLSLSFEQLSSRIGGLVKSLKNKGLVAVMRWVSA